MHECRGFIGQAGVVHHGQVDRPVSDLPLQQWIDAPRFDSETMLHCRATRGGQLVRKRTAAREDRRELPAYSIAEAAHYLTVPEATIRYWATGTAGPIPTAYRDPVR